VRIFSAPVTQKCDQSEEISVDSFTAMNLLFWDPCGVITMKA
jgi:hypothetical protein